MRKNAFAIAAICLFGFNVLASDLNVKMEGMLNFETGFRKQSKVPKESSNISPNRKNFAMDSNATFGIIVDNEADFGKYGGRLNIQTSARGSSSTSYSGSNIFIESNIGKFQFGSDFDAATKMRVDGFAVAKGSGDNWTKYAWFGSGDQQWVQTLDYSPLSSGYVMNNGLESSRKITYFTPKLVNTLQFGISYIPDSSNIANKSISSGTTNDRTVVTTGYTYKESTSVKDAVSVGATIERDITNDISVKVSATGQYGKVNTPGVVVDNTTNDSRQYKVDNLKVYNVGAVVNYGPLSFAGSYDAGRAFTSKEVEGKDRRKSTYYTAAAGYTQGPVGVSLFYTRGKRVDNKVDAYTLGAEYKLAPGLVPYVELTCFKGVGRRLAVYNDSTKLKRKGTIALVGATLKF